jgi:hypothetical protein
LNLRSAGIVGSQVDERNANRSAFPKDSALGLLLFGA